MMPPSTNRIENLAAGRPVMVTSPAPGSTKRALVYVYLGYGFRYVYLLLLIPFYARVLGAAEYGRLLSGLSLFQIVWLLVEYGFPIVGARDTAASADRRHVSAIYGQHLAGRLALVIPGALIGIGGTLLSPLLREAPLLGALATITGLVAAFNLGWHFQGRLQFRTSVMLEALGFSINLPLILVFVHGPDDAWIVMLCLLVSSVICTAAAHWIAFRSLERAAVKLTGVTSLLRQSTVLFVYKGLTMLMSSASPLLMSLFASAQQVGLFGAAERLANVALSLLQPANQVLTGTVSSLIGKTGQQSVAHALIRRSFVVMTGLGVLFSAGAFLLARPLVPVVLGEEFSEAVPMLLILALMFPFVAFSQVASSYVLIPLRMDNWVSIVSIFGATATLLLILLLGTRFAGAGVAWGRTVAQVLMTLLLIAVFLKTRVFRSHHEQHV